MEMEVKVKVQIELSDATQAFLVGLLSGRVIKDPAPAAKPTLVQAPAAPAEPEEENGTAAPSDEEILSMSEEELMSVSVKDLTAVLKRNGVDPSKIEGKNTNAKLRKMVLALGEQEEKPEEEPAAAPAPSSSKIKLDITVIRTLMSSKVNDYRSEIKAKLTELGATNVSTLEESDYKEFYSFLQEL